MSYYGLLYYHNTPPPPVRCFSFIALKCAANKRGQQVNRESEACSLASRCGNVGSGVKRRGSFNGINGIPHARGAARRPTYCGGGAHAREAPGREKKKREGVAVRKDNGSLPGPAGRVPMPELPTTPPRPLFRPRCPEAGCARTDSRDRPRGPSAGRSVQKTPPGLQAGVLGSLNASPQPFENTTHSPVHRLRGATRTTNGATRVRGSAAGFQPPPPQKKKEGDHRVRRTIVWGKPETRGAASPPSSPPPSLKRRTPSPAAALRQHLTRRKTTYLFRLLHSRYFLTFHFLSSQP